jgi:hypothetical protein
VARKRKLEDAPLYTVRAKGRRGELIHQYDTYIGSDAEKEALLRFLFSSRGVASVQLIRR